MSLINEALARAHCSERLAAAEEERRVRELVGSRPARLRSVQRAERLAIVRKVLAARS